MKMMSIEASFRSGKRKKHLTSWKKLETLRVPSKKYIKIFFLINEEKSPANFDKIFIYFAVSFFLKVLRPKT